MKYRIDDNNGAFELYRGGRFLGTFKTWDAAVMRIAKRTKARRDFIGAVVMTVLVYINVVLFTAL